MKIETKHKRRKRQKLSSRDEKSTKEGDEDGEDNDADDDQDDDENGDNVVDVGAVPVSSEYYKYVIAVRWSFFHRFAAESDTRAIVTCAR